MQRLTQRSRLVGAGALVGALLLVPWAAVPGSTDAVTSTAVPAVEALAVQPWPGSQSVRTVDVRAELGTDLSGISYRAGRTRADDVIWGVDDRQGIIHRLVQRGGAWRPDTADGWSRGKRFTFPDGKRPDAEGIVVHDGAAWVSTERVFDGVSRTSILRVALSGTGTTLRTTREWKLAKEFPHLGSNVGLEALDLVPDSFLVAHRFRDEARKKTYDPAAYPRKVGGGVFVTAAEASSLKGQVRAYVLNDDGTFVRVATIANPMGLVMALDFDADSGTLWMACDDGCDGRVATARIQDGRFVVTGIHARPTGLGNYNHEGFTVAPAHRCSNGVRPVFWANDANNGGHALRQGSTTCPAAQPPTARRAATMAVKAPHGRTGTVRKVRVRVRAGGAPAASGKVVVRVQKRVRTKRLTRGRAVVRIGRFARPGRRVVRVSYVGDTVTEAAKGRAVVRIRKARRR